MIELYGRKRITRDDIPAILNGKIPYDKKEHGEHYFIPLSNGRFETAFITPYAASRGQDLKYEKIYMRRGLNVILIMDIFPLRMP